MKRLVDIMGAIAILIIFSPLWVLIALLIKISSKGPLIYRSLRVKKNFQLFYCYKFRTMYQDADKRLENLLNASNTLKKEWDRYQKLKNDPRVTSIGKFLRKTSLDELPQLINVIKGEMSLVGPRPYAVFGPKEMYKNELYSLYGKEIETILSLKPGLTGLWQISGRNQLPLEKRIELDLEYVKKNNLRLDLLILAKTIPEIFVSKGAF